MLNILSFINKFFWKDKLNFFFSWILPFALVLLANITFTCSVNAADITNSALPDTNVTFLSPIYVVPGVATLSVICLTCLSLPLVVYSFKKTDVIKRIAMKINNNWSFYLMIALFYLPLSFMSYLFSFFIGSLVIWAVDHQNGIYIKYMLENASYGNLFFSIFAFTFLGSAIGILMATLLNSIVSIQIVGAALVLFSIFLGGGGIPLQYIAMYSQNSDTHQFKPFSIWTVTYFSPFRYPTTLILESVTQGPAFNNGILTADQWNQDIVNDILHNGKFDSINDYLSMRLGYTSIFDINHPFITNMVPIPYFDLDFGNGHILNTWYVNKCQGDIELFGFDVIDMWRFDPILYGSYWSGDINAIFSMGIMPSWFPINNIPVFTFAAKTDKLLDLIIPFVMVIIFLGSSVGLYKRNVINAKG
ncbi:MAG: hypothetical protein LBF00_04260 [Mycoplasmataceae bacterium]|nr:hypothetical protein [Mycoplasmataceae bacterium]